MPRTEKKFGQANQISGHGSTELVASSANRKNILLNITARADSRIGVSTFNGATAVDGGASYTSVATVQNPVLVDNSMLAVRAFAFNKTFTKLFAINSTNQCIYSVSFSGSGASYVRTANSSLVTDQLTNGMLDYGFDEFAGSDLFAAPAVWIDDSYILIYSAEVTTATSTELRLALLATTGSNVSIISSYYQPADAVNSTAQQYYGVYALQNGVGYALNGSNGNASVTAGENAVGIRVFSSGAQSGTVWWDLDGTAGKTSGLALQFFAVSAYNPVYDVYAFGSSPNASNPWLGVTATGGTGSLSSNLPSLPASAAPAGFRIVASNGANGSDRKFLDGTISYPSAPTGIAGFSVPTETNTAPPVTSLKFSPSGEHLLVTYQNNYDVIYTRQGNGTWAYSAQVTVPGVVTPSGSAWFADGAGIFTVENAQTTTHSVHAINAQVSNSALLPVTKAASFANTYTKSPGFPVMTGSGGMVQHNGSQAQLTSASISHVTAVGVQAFGSVLLADGRPMIIVGTTEDGDLQTALSDSIWTIVPEYAVSVGDGDVAPGYVNTAVADLELAAGSTLQISGIVLENGESLRVGVADNNAIDVVAYGVEIS